MVAYERSFDGRKGVKIIVRQLLTLDIKRLLQTAEVT